MKVHSIDLKKEVKRSKVNAQEMVEETYFKKEENSKQATNDQLVSGSVDFNGLASE